MKIAVLLLVLSLSLGVTKTASAVTQNIQDIFSVTDCGGVNQLCGQDHLKTFTMSANGTASASFQVGAGHCSPSHVYTYVDDILVGTTPDLGYPDDPLSRPLTATFFNNLNLLAGDHTIRLTAEGILGGCNIGALDSWGGEMNIQTNETLAPEPGFGPFHLNVIKHVVGGTAIAGQFTVNATGASASPSVFHPSESGTDVTLDAFSDYTVTEDAFANYTPSYSPDCSGTSVNEFHPKTCTITNTYVPPTGGGEGDPNTGHIIVDKVTNPAGDETSFDFTTTGTGYNAFSLKDDTAPNNQTLLVGAYSVTEGSLSGWTLTNTVCTSTLDEVSVNPNTFNLHANETITCTFTNTKDSTPPSGGGDSGGNLIVARGGGGRPPVSQGAVLGASTTNNGGQVLGAETSCGIYLDKFLRKGYKGNNVDGVKKLQQFLNDYFKAELKVDGIFGKSTEVALKKFQIEHKEKILAPWHITIPTGIFYLTTQAEINNIMCPTLNLPIPTNLIPFDSNPESPKI